MRVRCNYDVKLQKRRNSIYIFCKIGFLSQLVTLNKPKIQKDIYVKASKELYVLHNIHNFEKIDQILTSHHIYKSVIMFEEY